MMAAAARNCPPKAAGLIRKERVKETRDVTKSHKNVRFVGLIAPHGKGGKREVDGALDDCSLCETKRKGFGSPFQAYGRALEACPPRMQWTSTLCIAISQRNRARIQPKETRLEPAAKTKSPRRNSVEVSRCKPGPISPRGRTGVYFRP